MDIVKVNSQFMTGLVGKAITSVLRKKIGFPVEVHPQDISIVVEGTTTKVHFIVDATMPTSQLEEFIKKNLL